MTINASSGQITWTPSEAQGPGTYPITVRVTDNGEPPLSTTQPLSLSVDEVNLPPVLAAFPNLTNHVGATISFTASATDPDLPGGSLSYSLDPGAPAGAVVNSATGLFQWTPSAPSTNTLTLRVTDNGTPALSDTQSFTIVVGPAIRVTGIEFGPANRQIVSWSALPGRSYQLETATNATANWTALGGVTTAAGVSATATNSVPADGLRLYRVRLTN